MNTYDCPTCDGKIPNNETPGAYPGALSRRDNVTEICSACGTREAMEDFRRYFSSVANTVSEGDEHNG